LRSNFAIPFSLFVSCLPVPECCAQAQCIEGQWTGVPKSDCTLFPQCGRGSLDFGLVVRRLSIHLPCGKALEDRVAATSGHLRMSPFDRLRDRNRMRMNKKNQPPTTYHLLPTTRYQLPRIGNGNTPTLLILRLRFWNIIEESILMIERN
jgi:hypothetical protein